MYLLVFLVCNPVMKQCQFSPVEVVFPNQQTCHTVALNIAEKLILNDNNLTYDYECVRWGKSL